VKYIKVYEEFNNPFIKGNDRKIIDIVYKILNDKLISGDMDYDIKIGLFYGLSIDNDKYHLEINDNFNGRLSGSNYHIKVIFYEPFEENEDDENDNIPIDDVIDVKINHYSYKLDKVISKLIKRKKKYNERKEKDDREDNVNKFVNRFNEEVNQDVLDKSYQDPVVGDTVYINYKVPGGNKDYIPTPVKIVSIKGYGQRRAYIASHKIEMSEFKNAPDQLIRRTDIIGPYKGVETPTGSGWVSSKPSINTGVNQVSNDMYL